QRQIKTLRAFGEPGVREALEALFPEQAAYLRQIIADARQDDYENTMKMLAGTHWFVSDGSKTLSNVALDKAGYPEDMDALTEKAWVKVERGKDNLSSPQGLISGNSWDALGKAALYLAWTPEALADFEGLYGAGRLIVWQYFCTAFALAILALVLLILLLVHTGRKRPAYGGTRKLWALDKIFAEFQIILFAASAILCLLALSELYYSGDRAWLFTNYLYITFLAAIVFALFIAALWFLLSLVRIGKAGLFAERSLISRFASGPFKALGGMAKSGFDGQNPLAKSILLVVLLWIVTSIFAGLCGILIRGGQGGLFFICGILLLLTLAGALCVAYGWAARYGRLRKGVEEIAGGNLAYQIEIAGDGKNEFDRLSARVNELGNAQNAAIQNELKNQRLKTDLISNVSHDLKTPLTSILTYTGLLKAEGLKSKNAEGYLQIIDEKGQRLQKLTEDLFDAAKASSGAIAVNKGKVDLLALVEQEIAEMNGGFDAVSLELVIDAEGDHYFVEADGQLLWRVVDNLLRNVRKYAQPGTRVYIELKEHKAGHAGRPGHPGQGGGAALASGQPMTTMEIKNISATKLNIPAEDLMERFKRGDESRATEGSGLGLAIAKDLVRLQNGWFEVAIDGDLFKAVVMLPPWAGGAEE
ncbi:MAG: HAMP domain-containing histidine kinase, partial [Clostridiales Family XIII bacterium]|nr:HAMP domain-containing histidine kinase [Clostridiales Family XIII bacterium]